MRRKKRKFLVEDHVREKRWIIQISSLKNNGSGFEFLFCCLLFIYLLFLGLFIYLLLCHSLIGLFSLLLISSLKNNGSGFVYFYLCCLFIIGVIHLFLSYCYYY